MDRSVYLGYLQLVWGWSGLFSVIFTADSLQLVIRVCLLTATFLATGNELSNTLQAMLSAAFFMSVVGMIDPLRVIACRVSLSRMTIRTAVEQAEVGHFVFYVAFWFMAFITAWEIADRESTFPAAFVFGVRALVIGDGDGLDFFNLKADDLDSATREPYNFKVWAGMGGMMIFFSYLMNLLIAVFNNTYDSAQKKMWLRFHAARVRELRDCILSHKLCLFHNLWSPSRMQVLCFSSGLLSFGLLMLIPLHSLPFGRAAVIISMTSILLMTTGALLLEAFPFAELMKGNEDNDWFPMTQDASKRRYLRVFCRTDFDENFFLGVDDSSEQALGEKLESIEGQMGERLERIEDQVDELGKRMNEMSEHISTQITLLAQRLGSG